MREEQWGSGKGKTGKMRTEKNNDINRKVQGVFLAWRTEYVSNQRSDLQIMTWCVVKGRCGFGTANKVCYDRVFVCVCASWLKHLQPAKAVLLIQRHFFQKWLRQHLLKCITGKKMQTLKVLHICACGWSPEFHLLKYSFICWSD